jgi:hypothetical protein
MKAFPTTYRNYDESISHDCTGMDLRDYFAAKAMQGIVDSSVEAGLETTQIADSAYRIADAMMKARNS